MKIIYRIIKKVGRKISISYECELDLPIEDIGNENIAMDSVIILQRLASGSKKEECV